MQILRWNNPSRRLRDIVSRGLYVNMKIAVRRSYGCNSHARVNVTCSMCVRFAEYTTWMRPSADWIALG